MDDKLGAPYEDDGGAKQRQNHIQIQVTIKFHETSTLKVYHDKVDKMTLNLHENDGGP